MKNNDELKQSKISRHEVAKQKFRYFQRSISSKSLNTKGDFVPGPGQFVVLSSQQKKRQQQSSQLPNIQGSQKKLESLQKDLKFTTNLKLIIRQRSPSRVSQLLNQTVNRKINQRRSLKKITKSQSTGNLRPKTALTAQLATDLQGKNNLNESKIIQNAAEYDKKYYLKKQYSQSNNFMVKSKSTIPKHAYGHKSIRLTQDDNQRRLKIQFSSNQRKISTKFVKTPIKQQQSDYFLTNPIEKTNFLPIQYYMINDQKPEELIEKYKMKQNFMVGYSRWQDLDGGFEWKKCRVIDYLKDKERWEIEWLHNGKRKIVARNNLFFQRENFENFEKIISEAENFRKHSQVYMKYNWLIDNLDTQTHTLEQSQLNRILRLVLNKTNSFTRTQTSLDPLIGQIKQKYVRANHIVQFNASLPFNAKHKQQFRGYLPQSYFTPSACLKKFQLKRQPRPISPYRAIEQAPCSPAKSTKVIPSAQLKKLFQYSVKKFCQTTALSSTHRIHIIQFLNKTQYSIKVQRISDPYELKFHLQQRNVLPQSFLKYFAFFGNKMYLLSDVQTRMENALFESIAKVNNVVCDVEYYVARELDPLYMEKRAYGYDQFQKTVHAYRKFLYAVNMRIQAIGRQLLFGMLNQFTSIIKTQGQILTSLSTAQFFTNIQKQKKFYSPLKLKIKFQIRGECTECSPKKSQIVEIFLSYISRLINQFSDLSCIRKSYIQELRPKNKMKVLESLQQVANEHGKQQSQWRTHAELNKIRQNFITTVNQCGQAYQKLYQQVKKIYDNIIKIQNDMKRKTSKKSNFSDIQEYLQNIHLAYEMLNKLRLLSVNTNLNFKNNNCDQSSSSNKLSTPENEYSEEHKIQEQNGKFIMNLNSTTQPAQLKFIKLGIFCFNIQQFTAKAQLKLQQISNQLYKLILEKITKQSQKIDKAIDLIVQRLQRQPSNIKQMISLQLYIQQQAGEQLYKMTVKTSELHYKFCLLQRLNVEADFKDFYECHKLYMKPMRVKEKMNQRLKAIQIQYKKQFGQELMRQINQLCAEIKLVQQKFYAAMQITSIDEMDSAFLVFSKLKQRIQTAICKSSQVNQYQTAMKWINTNFQRLSEVQKQFWPYYQLISLEKNYRFHIEIQLAQSLHTMDANRISQEVLTGCGQLANLEVNVFYNNPTILEIVKYVGQDYKKFREKLPLLQILRNSDLRQRHWTSIKQLTGFNDILSEKITYQELEERDIMKYEKRLIEISHIATRQLIYEKRLNKMKKEWKQMKIMMKRVDENVDQKNTNQLKIITNLDEIQVKTQNDIYQIQQILSSKFIKFLQKDIVNWRNFTLYKMYEFIEIWKILEKQLIQMHQMFNRPTIRNQASNEHQKFKSLEKTWRTITNQIQQQPNIIQLIQTKINDSLKYAVELVEELKKSITQFFEKKKQRFSRFGSLSQEELMALFSKNEQTQVFDQAVRKCLHGVKDVVRNKNSKIACVKTHLNEQIVIKQNMQRSESDDELSPDKIIQDIQKRIKRSLRNSVEDLSEQTGKTLQIILFHQRIIFTKQIQNQLIRSQDDQGQKGISQGYIDALLGLKSKIIRALHNEYLRVYEVQNKSKKQQNLIKIQAQLNQLMNHLQIADFLYNKNVRNVYDFEWLSQIRTYHKNGSYVVQIGLNHLEYGFEIIDQQNFIVQQNTARTFFHISMATKQRMFSILSGNIGSGKLAALNYLANVHGKNQYVLNCHKALSYQNVFDFFRMAANGIWIVFNSLNLLSDEVLSCFRQSSQLFWANYPTIKAKSYFMLGDKNITFNTHEIGLFGTVNLSKNSLLESQRISSKLGSYFRIFTVLTVEVQYVLECKLVLAGFQYFANTKKLIKMIKIIEGECERFYGMKKDQGFEIYKSLTFSKLNFIEKVVYFAKQSKNKYKDQNIDDFLLLQLGLSRVIEQITKNLDGLKLQILQKLSKFFNFTVKLPIKSLSLQRPSPFQLATGSQNSDQQDQVIKRDIKKLFLDRKLFSNRQIINHYFQILQTLKQKHSIIILGSCSTGKSVCIDLLSQNKITRQEKKGQHFNYVNDFKINLYHVHPNAYSLKQLYGDVQRNGIVNCLIKQGYQALQKQKTTMSPQQGLDMTSNLVTRYGIVFDSQIGDWIQPLLPLLKNSVNYIQPNGKNIIVEHPMKLIFQCRDLSSVSPSIILSTNIVQLQDYQLKWQNIFSHYLKKNFKEYYQKKSFLDFCELMVTFIMEPVLEFFKSSISSSTSKASTLLNNQNHSSSESNFISQIHQSFLRNQINYIPLIFNLFIALVENHFLHQSQQQKSKLLKTQDQERKPQNYENEMIFSTFQDKQRSSILNIFLTSITWTIGLYIPQQSKKTFSRHFKYIIKRAVQLNIKGIQKDCLPKDDQDIYQICYINSKWYSWEQIPKAYNQKQYNHLSCHSSEMVLLKPRLKYLFFMEKYCSTNIPFFVVGKSSTGKNSLMLQFLNSISNQTYNKVMITCTPNSTHFSAKIELRKQIQKQKYSHTFKGFVHGKMTLFYLCDMNLPLIKNQISLDQFMHSYIKRKGWYLNHSSQFFEFKNINFCGTLNSSYKFSQHLLKYLNPLPYIQSQSDIKSHLFQIFSRNQLLQPYKESVVNLMMNLQQVVSRQLRFNVKISEFTLKDLCDIAEKINFKVSPYLFRGKAGTEKNIVSSLKIEDNEKLSKNKILHCWIDQTESKYLQKFGSNYDKEKIFYFINNVLMEEQRTRYKSIIASQNMFLTNLPYYVSKFRIEGGKRQSKLNKTFLSPSSYKIYDSLSQIQVQIECLQKHLQKSRDLNQQYTSLSMQIQNSISNNKQTNNISSYIRAMNSLLDYFLEQKSYLIFLVNDKRDEQVKEQLLQQGRANTESTLRQLFTTNAIKVKQQIHKQRDDYKMTRLLNYVCKVNNSQVLEYQTNRSMSDSTLDWKIFITQLFQLINSPSSANLYSHYVVHLKGIKMSENFILEDILRLKRTGNLTILEHFLNSQEIQIQQMILEKQSQQQNTQQNSSNSKLQQASSDERSTEKRIQIQIQNYNQAKSRKQIAQRKKEMDMIMRRNTAQIIKDKILKKLKFVVSLDQESISNLKLSYSVLLEKCHFLWVSHLYSQPSTSQVVSSKRQIQQQPSMRYNLIVPSSASLNKNSSQQQQQSLLSLGQLSNTEPEQPQRKQDVKKSYNNHKQSFNQFLTFTEVKQLYLNVQCQKWSKQQIKVKQSQIDAQTDLQFLQFLSMYQNIKLGIQVRIIERIEEVEKLHGYFTNLEQSLLVTLSRVIKMTKGGIDLKQEQIKLLSSKIQKLQEQNLKFQRHFAKSEQCINFLQKESKEANQLYNSYTERQQTTFSSNQASLVQVLKSGKDKKILLTNQMKMLIQILGLVIGKKIKPQENMFKEMVKDIAVLKVHKKVINLVVQTPLSHKVNEKALVVSQKAALRLRQFVMKNLQHEFNFASQLKQQKAQIKHKQISFSQHLLLVIKQYLISLLIYYTKSQQQPIYQLNKKCLKCLKQITKTREQYTKSKKSKQYQKVKTQLQTNRRESLEILSLHHQQIRQFERFKRLEKRCLEIICLNINGDVDGKEFESKGLFDRELMLTSGVSTTNNTDIVVERIKMEYSKMRQNISIINNCKDVLALVIVTKLMFQSAQQNGLHADLFYKTLSKETLDTMKNFKVNVWEGLVDNNQAKQNQANSQQRIDVFQYFLRQFDNLKALSFVTGMVCLQKTAYIQNWMARNQRKVLWRYENSVLQKLGNFIDTSQTYAQKEYVEDLARPFILIELRSVIEIQLIKSQIEKEANEKIQSYLSRNLLILICQKSTFKEFRSSKVKSLPLQGELVIHQFVFVSQNTKFLAQMQTRFQDQLCLQRKQSDMRMISLFNQLKDAQKQATAQRKQLIKNCLIEQFCSYFPCQPPIPQPETQLSSLILATQQTLDKLQQNLISYASISSNLQSLPNIVSLKKRANIHATKVIRFIIRVYQGLRILQAQGVVQQTNGSQRFCDYVLSVMQREKELQKGQNSQTKLLKSIKNKIWENYLLVNNNRKTFIGLVFAIAGQETLTESQYQKLLGLILRLYQYSVKVQSTDMKIQKHINQSLNTARNLTFFNNFFLFSQQQTQSSQQNPPLVPKPYITEQFQQILDLLAETFTCFKDLKHNILKKMNVWTQFFQNIALKFGQNIVNTLPQPYNDINRAYFGLFVAIFDHQKVQQWINVHLIQEDLFKLDDIGYLSDQSKILRLSKLGYKQTVLLGDNALNKLYDLAGRTRRQIRLYSKVQSQKRSASSSSALIQSSLKSSVNTTKKQIPLNQLSFFSNRRFQQQFVEQLYHCMKNSSWLVIDLQNFRYPLDQEAYSTTGQSSSFDTKKLQTIVKLVDFYMNASNQEENEDENYVDTTHHMISEASQKSFSLPKVNKNQFNAKNFQTCDYHVFFVFPASMKKEALRNTLVQNHRRSILQLSQSGQIQRCQSITKLYLDQLMSSKKIIKDFETLDFNVKQLVYLVLTIHRESLVSILSMGMRNRQYISNLPNDLILNMNKTRQVTQKVSKLLLLFILQPQNLTQIINPASRSLPAYQQEQKQIQAAQNQQKHTNNHPYKSASKNLIRRPSQKTASNNGTRQSICLESKRQLNVQKQVQVQWKKDGKYSKIIGIIKIIQSYVQSSFDQKQRKVLGIDNIWQYYQNSCRNDINVEKMSKLEQILLDKNRTNTSNKSTLQNLLIFMKQNLEGNGHKQLKIKIKKTLINSQSSQSDCVRNHFSDFKLFMERFVRINPDSVRQENITQRIVLLIQIKRSRQIQLSKLKKQLVRVEASHGHQSQKNNQFNFASLTQNVNLQQMRKKLSLSKKKTSEQHKNSPNEKGCIKKLREYLLKAKQNQIQSLQQQVSILKALKSIFLLQRINYEKLFQTWKKLPKQNNPLQLMIDLFNLTKPLKQHSQMQQIQQKQTTNYAWLNNLQSFKLSYLTQEANQRPLFNLSTFSNQNQLQGLVQLLKQVFSQVNELRPPSVQHRFVLQGESRDNLKGKSKKQSRNMKSNCKVCSFEGMGLWNCHRSKGGNILDRNRLIMSQNQDIGFQKFNEGLKLALYFQKKEEHSDSESQSSDTKRNSQIPDNISAKKQSTIPFYLTRLTQSMNSILNHSQRLGYVNILIELQNKPQKCEKKGTNSFIYY